MTVIFQDREYWKIFSYQSEETPWGENCFNPIRKGSGLDNAIREAYLAEEDERLGRERFEVNGETYYVYPSSWAEDRVRILWASDGESEELYKDLNIPDTPTPGHVVALRQWQIKHGISVEREPQEGELWDVIFEGVLTKRCVVRDGRFVNVRDTDTAYPFSHTSITSKEFVA